MKEGKGKEGQKGRRKQGSEEGLKRVWEGSEGVRSGEGLEEV